MSDLNVLSIGNSFSNDAHRYLHRVAKSEGEKIETINLYIGGCSLLKHFQNIMGEKKDYELMVDGFFANRFFCDVKTALLARKWDVITLQQASHESFIYDTYSPYLPQISDYVRKMCPEAKIFIHQTWAYETGSDRILNVAGFNTYDEMFEKVEKSYADAAKLIGADKIIPCGRAMKNALDLGIKKVHRDTFHASLGLGRFILALTWYKALTGNSIDNVKFNDFDEPVSSEEYKTAIEAVNKAF